jgi:3-oxoacyl-[acyl-carrier protein] reductase
MNRNSRPVAVVTGGRRGIGRGIALALARSGHDVVVLDLTRDSDAENTLAQIAEMGSQAAFVQADIAEAERAQAICEEAYAALGRVDVLVNNAGVQVNDRKIEALETSIESFDRLMTVNLRGTFFLTQAFARRMVSDTVDSPEHPRSIITISSSNAHHAKVNGSEYCISKAGLSMVNKVFALQLAPHGIACYEVQPGLIKTDLNASLHDLYEPIVRQGFTPIRRWGTPEDVGRAVATLACGSLPFVTGETIHVDGGLHVPKSPFESPFVKDALAQSRA